MDSEEKEIFDYLKSWGKQFVSAREICRRAGGKQKWAKSPHWAIPYLNGMVDKKILETDSMAHYRILPDAKAEKKKRWISPEIEKILENAQKNPVDIEAEPEPPQKSS